MSNNTIKVSYIIFGGAAYLAVAVAMALVTSGEFAAAEPSNSMSSLLLKGLDHAYSSEQEESRCETARSSLEHASQRHGLQASALERVKDDPRWDDPEQREGLVFAVATTSAMVDEEERVMVEALAQIEDGDCAEDDRR